MCYSAFISQASKTTQSSHPQVPRKETKANLFRKK